MLLPPYGICLPARYLRALDARTIEVSVGPASVVCTVELADCSCPALSESGGSAARDAADAILADADHLSVCLPLPCDPAVIVQAMAGERRNLAGHVFVDGDTTLTQHLIRRGLGERRPVR